MAKLMARDAEIQNVPTGRALFGITTNQKNRMSRTDQNSAMAFTFLGKVSKTLKNNAKQSIQNPF
jgi:hypothetical protein